MRALKASLLSISGYLIRKIWRNKIKFNNHFIYTASKLVTNQTVALVFFNRYEKEEVRFCENYLTNDLDIIELGTSVGVVASKIQQSFNENRMICVEANNALHALLRKTFEINKFQNVTLLNLAISDSSDTVCFDFRGSNELGKIVEHSKTRVKTKTLLSILTEHNVKEYYLVSDIEGAECSFILGKGLENCRLMIIELHKVKWKNKEYTIQDLVQLILEKGFVLIDNAENTFVFKRVDQKKK